MKNDYKIMNIFYNQNEKLKKNIHNFNIKNENLKSQFRVVNAIKYDNFDFNFNNLNREIFFHFFFRIIMQRYH